MDYEMNNGMVHRKLVSPEVIFFVLLVLVQRMMVVITALLMIRAPAFRNFKKRKNSFPLFQTGSYRYKQLPVIMCLLYHREG